MTDAVFNYLRHDGGRTAASMWADIARLRRLGIAYADLPATFPGFLAALEALRAEGRASVSNQLWLAEYPAEKTKHSQQELFA